MGVLKKIVFFILALWSTTVYASVADFIVVPPSEKIFSGETVVFSIFAFNSGKENIACRLPDELICKMVSQHQEIVVYATALSPNTAVGYVVGKGGFIKKQYQFIIPTFMNGPVRFRVDGIDAVDVMFAVAENPIPEERKGAGHEGASPMA